MGDSEPAERRPALGCGVHVRERAGPARRPRPGPRLPAAIILDRARAADRPGALGPIDAVGVRRRVGATPTRAAFSRSSEALRRLAAEVSDLWRSAAMGSMA